MQTRFLSLAVALASALLASCAGAEIQATSTGTAGHTTSAVSVDLFYDALAPYGSWIRRGGVGWIWVPSAAVVGADFTPYATAGRSRYSNVGWMFVSDWDWGWAPFHYGRWYFDPLYGWVWVPDTVWGPAWVDWSIGAGLIGWWPLPPRYHVPMRDLRTHRVFVASRDFSRPAIESHLLAPSASQIALMTPARQQVKVGTTTWLAGPDPSRVEAATGTRIRPVQVTPPRAGVVTRMRIEGRRAVALPVPRHYGSRTLALPPDRSTHWSQGWPERGPGAARWDDRRRL